MLIYPSQVPRLHCLIHRKLAMVDFLYSSPRMEVISWTHPIYCIRVERYPYDLVLVHFTKFGFFLKGNCKFTGKAAFGETCKRSFTRVSFNGSWQ